MIKDKNLPSRTRKSPPLLTSDEQPLLRLLVAEATRRGDTLAELAKVLGVTYERLAQWRRGAAQISKATRSAHQKAASYLGLPTVLILVLSGMTELSDFVWPQRESLRTRLGREIERMRQDPYLGAFVPKELATAEPAIKLFVTFMFHELESGPRHAQSASQWLSALHLASTGNRDSQLELEKLREAAIGSLRVF